MLSYVGRRALYSVPVILIASFLTFAFVRATFDPTARLRSSREATTAIRAERVRLGLNRPLVEQYGSWLGKFVQGDWGTSERTHEAVTAQIGRALGNTTQLIVWGVLLAALVAVTIGVYSALRQYSVLDYTFTGMSFIGLALPPFWFGLIAIEFLAVGPKQWFHLSEAPLFFVGLHGSSGGVLDYARHLVLPVLTLTVQIIAGWSRFQRASMLDVMSSDYIRTARAKGVPRRRVVLRHGLRNALVPLVTVMALDIAALFAGLIVTE
ncbi:MAG TPA: ABC transporter permease [Acidimicrobiia bacterium]|nr:ABC transporter permease [Acidimicrobiia bacterium]